jgi:hypothetical protein
MEKFATYGEDVDITYGQNESSIEFDTMQFGMTLGL